MVENFADHPKSITEVRAERSESARDWTPRDVLIDILRDIDSKKINPEAVVVSMRSRSEDGSVHTHYRASSPDHHITVGVMTAALFMVQKESAS